ncbi:MAG: endopeptidase clp chloroplast precursor [Trebouxia sp. A1-2]|nr:MAG: endopeptidase clp chloroplast precursor [Trebouxia sp. A1-2]
MGMLLEANMMSIHAEGCQCAGRPAVHPRLNARALRQPCNTWQKSSTRQLSGTCRQRASAQSSAHEHVQASSQPVLAPRTQEMGGDPMGMLLRQRIVFLGGEVNDFNADAIISQLLLLDSTDPTKDIKLFINSPGGSVTAGMGIYDAMQMCRADVSTYCFGLAASMGAFLLTAGTKGKRFSMPNARIMIHQPLGGASGQAVDIEIQAKEIMFHKGNLNAIMAECTGQPIDRIEEDTDRDRYMSPLEAKNYGLIDEVIGGDEAGFQISGTTRDFPKTKESYVNWGDFDEDGDQGGRFRGKPLEPYTKPLADE